MHTLREVLALPRPLRVVFAGTAINRLGAFVFPYLTIYLSQARGFSLAVVGQVLAVGALGLFAGNLAGGWLTDRWSRKGTLLLALVINALGYLGLARELDSAWSYAGLLALGYFGTGLYGPAANTVVADLTDDRERPLAYTVHYVCINVGMGLGPLLGGVLYGVGYRWVFLGDVASSLTCALLIAALLPETRGLAEAGNGERRPDEEQDADRLGRATISTPQVVLFCLASFFLIAPLMGLEVAVPLFVQRVFSADLSWVGAIYSINALTILSLSFLVERALRGRNELAMMVLAGALWSLGVGLFAFGYTLGVLVACTLVWTLGEMIASIVAPAYVARHAAAAIKGRMLSLIEVSLSQGRSAVATLLE